MREGNTFLRRLVPGGSFLREGQQAIPVVLVLGAAGRDLGGEARRNVVHEGIKAIKNLNDSLLLCNRRHGNIELFKISFSNRRHGSRIMRNNP